MSAATELVAEIRRLRAALRELGDPTRLLGEWVATEPRRRALEAELAAALTRLGALTVDALDAQAGPGWWAALEAADRPTAGAPEAPAPEAPAHADDGTPALSTRPTADTATTTAATAEADTSEAETAATAEATASTRPEDASNDRTIAHDPPEPPAPARVEITPEVLTALSTNMKGGGDAPTRTSPGLSDRVAHVATRALEVLGPTPDKLRTSKHRKREMTRLAKLRDELLDEWGRAGERMNQALLQWVTARARALQAAINEDRRGGVKHEAERREIERLFRTLVGHSKGTQPGPVHGLARRHTPRDHTWLEDAGGYEGRLHAMLGRAPEERPQASPFNADDALRRLTQAVRAGLEPRDFAKRAAQLIERGVKPTDTRLVGLAEGYADDALTGKRLKPLRAAVADARAEGDDAAGSKASRLPPDWPHFRHTRGRTAAIVGGDPRPERERKLEEAFGFERLEWIDTSKNGTRHTQALVQRMGQGTVDLVIVLRAFCSHKVSDKVFAARGERCRVVLADSYGMTQIQRAIERFFGDGPEA